ncbi:MAG: gliding motility-associated protein GldE [Bacteroidetes bacterium]|nr:MAG: gliding motility-associated protein GldE [Bacteroidota bacterium]
MDDPFPETLLYINPVFLSLEIIVFAILLFLSALFSGSEVAFFSLTPSDKQHIKEEGGKISELVLLHLEEPKKLLATILVANNTVNIGIVVLSTYLVEPLLQKAGTLSVFFIQVIGVTFLILLFGEVIPKVYANKHKINLAKKMAYPLFIAGKLFAPVSHLLVSSSAFLEKKLARKNSGTHVSVEELSTALELTSDEEQKNSEEHKILEGIVKFGNTNVKQIMTPRTDVVALEINTPFSQVKETILKTGFSRIPVYEETFDKIKGVLYIKDLLPYIEQENFKWNKKLREPYFVPENKKIDDLLKDFQELKIHLAIVVDEFGGTSGIVTLEDILEEIVGDISDEFDDEDVIYSKLDDYTYVFDGKTQLSDFYRILEVDEKVFADIKGDTETLAGLLIELSGKILRKNEKVTCGPFTFIVESADKRRIKRIKVIVNKPDEQV